MFHYGHGVAQDDAEAASPPPRGIQAPFFFANLRLTRMLRNVARALLGSQARASSCALRARSALKQRQQQSKQSIFTQQNPSSALVNKLFLHEHEPMQQDASISLRRRQHSAPGRSCNAPACIASHHQQFSFAAGSNRCFALRCAGAAAPMAAVRIQKWAYRFTAVTGSCGGCCKNCNKTTMMSVHSQNLNTQGVKL